MRSIVWDGDQPVNQAYGCTDLTAEPFWASCRSKRFHCGLDIGDPNCKGKSIYAARAGTVVALGWGVLGIRTASGETDFYLHGEYGPGLGQAVACGQRIGVFSDRVPSGGVLYGPHLHFEVQTGRLNFPGTSLDPEPVLTAALAGGASGQTTGGFGTLTDAEIQARFVAVLDAVAGNRAATDAIDGAMFYPETDPKWGTYSALLNRRLEAAAVKAAGGSLTAAQAQTLQEAHDAVQQLAAARASDQGAVLAAFSDLKGAIANIKITGGGLTPEQDAHLAAIETAAQQLEQQFAAGLKVEITATVRP